MDILGIGKIDSARIVQFGDYLSSSFSKEQVFTIQKGKLILKDIKQLGDKNTVCLYGTKRNIKPTFDIEAFKEGICFHKDFDFDEQSIVGFLHKFGEEDVEDLQDFINHLELNVKIESENNFYFIRDCVDFKTLFQKIQNYQSNFHFHKIFSLMFGLSLVYGDYKIGEEGVSSVVLDIPFNFYMRQYLEQFIELIKFLFENLFMLKIKVVDTEFGNVVRLTIQDEEIIDYFIGCFGNYLELGNYLKSKNKSFLNQISEYLDSEGYDLEIDKEKFNYKFVAI